MIILPTFAAPAHAGHDEHVDPASLPTAVTKAIETRFPGGRTTKAKLERKKDRTKYEVDVCQSGRAYEVEVFVDGTIDEVEDEGVCAG